MLENLKNTAVSELSNRKPDLTYDLVTVLEKLNVEVKVEEKI